MTKLEEEINTDLAQKRIEDNLNLPKHIAKKLDIPNDQAFNKSGDNNMMCNTQLESNNIM